MAIALFGHNQDAYTAAMQMLQTTGKPTGQSKTVKALTTEQVQQLSAVGIKPQKAALEIA